MCIRDSFGSAPLNIEGNDTRPFLSILLIKVETNNFMVLYGLSWDIMGVNGITIKNQYVPNLFSYILQMMHKPGSVNY